MPAPAISVLPLGALLQTFTVADLPLVLSLPSQSAYATTRNPAFFGETIGRVANRISRATLHLNSEEYPLPANNGPNTLHGGPRAWGKRLWAGPFAEHRNEKEATRFELRSAHGDNGFPGGVVARAWYTAWEEDGRLKLAVEYEAEFDPDGADDGVRETAVNMTNHTAFSLGPVVAGQSRSVAGTRVTLDADAALEVDAALLPTGNVTKHASVTRGEEFVLGADGPAFDHCFVLPGEEGGGDVPLDTRGRALRRLMAARHEGTGVRFEAWSTEPAFQFYTGEHIDVEWEGVRFGRRAGFCCEASRFVDAATREAWRGQVLMRRGERWGSRTVYVAWKE